MTENIISTKELLNQASNKDLEPLVEYILKASTEQLSSHPDYKRHHPNHTRYAMAIYDEIRLFGGNTIANLFRKEGPPYIKALQNAARKVGVKDVKNCSELELEQRMLQELLRKVLKDDKEKKSEEIQELLRETGLNEKDYKAFISGASLASLLAPHLYRTFLSHTSRLIAKGVSKQMLGHGLRMGSGILADRSVTVLGGPAAVILAGVWTAIDIAGPAYRVTVPCILHIAMLRQQWMANQEVEPLEDVFSD